LDPLSARFLGFWHNQNQPIEVFHGQTKGGILYPTQQGMVVVKDQGRKRARQSITIKTERIGPNHVRDVFSGQVLSLHPLSGFFMKDPALCAIAGRFFTSKTAVRGITPGQVERCGDYWDLVGAILGAAHLYRQALDRQADARGVRQREGAERVAAVGPLDYGESSILEAFAEARQIRCPACGGKLIYDKYHPAEAGASTFQVEYTCNSCKRPVPISVDATDFVPWLRSGD
jgi:DNA-directed RNA polymerase subunit RPC12/RpoP